jgi:fibronectin-binding autotransporter adhesin
MKKFSTYQLFPLSSSVTRAALILCSLPMVVTAAEVHWDSNGTTAGAGATPTGNWGTSAFWSADSTGSSATVTSWNTADTAVFAAGSDATSPYTITVNANTAASGLRFEEGSVTFLSATSAKSLTVNSNLELTLGTRIVIVGSSTAATNVHLLLGSNTLTLNTGNLDLYGNNTMASSLLKSGNVTLGNANALGTTGSVTIGDTAASSSLRMRMRTLSLSRPLVLQSGTGFTTNATLDNIGFNSPTVTGGITSTGTGTTNLTIESVISGSGSSLTFTVSGANAINHTGALMLKNGGTGTANPTGTVTVSAPIGANVTTVTVNDTSGGAKGLQRVVIGNAANAWTGNTTVNSPARLELSANDSIPHGVDKGNLTVNGTLVLKTSAGDSTETINGLSGSGTITRSGAFGTSTLVVGENDASGSFSGTIGQTAGVVALTKIGAGTLTLSGANTYTGLTTVSQGTLTLESVDMIADSASIDLSTSATLHLTYAGTDTINALFIDGVPQASGTWGAVGSGATHQTASITGTGLLLVTNQYSDLYWDGTGTAWDSSTAWSLTEADASSNPAASPTVTNVTRFGGVGVTTDQVIQLNADQTTAAMHFTSPVNFSFVGGNADHLLTVGAISVDAASNGPVFGSTTAGQKVDLVVSGSPTWTNNSGVAMLAHNSVDLGAGTLTITGTGNTTLEGGVTGSGAITKTGAGVLHLSGANSHGGLTSIQTGTAVLGNATALGSTAATTMIGGGATLDLNGQTVGAEGITLGVGSAGNLINSNTITAASLSGEVNLNFNGNIAGPGHLNLTGVIKETAGAKTLTVLGGGRKTFSGPNTFTGAVNVNGTAGTPENPNILRLEGVAPLGTGTKTVTSNTGTAGNFGIELAGGIIIPSSVSWALSGNTNALRSVSGANEIQGTINITSGAGETNLAVDLGSTLLVSNNISSSGAGGRILILSGAGNGTISGIVADGSTQARVTKNGSGTWTLTGINTYTGNTIVNGGTLSVTHGTFADASSITVATGATLHLDFAGTDTVAGVTLGGVMMGPGTYTASHPSGLITGTGSLVIPGSDPFTPWINTFTFAPGADKTKAGDPDGDGMSNELEFALDGDPASGAATGKVVGKIDSGHLTLTLPVRTGATFNGSGPLLSLAVDGVVYRIDGDDDLTGFNSGVEEVTALTGNMPLLTPGWTYRTFRLTAATNAAAKGFLRADVTAP